MLIEICMAFPFCFWCPRQLLLLIFFILQGKTYRIFILKVLFLSLYCVRQVRVKFYYFCFLGVYSYANLNLEESRVRSSAKVISSSFVFKPNLISDSSSSVVFFIMKSIGTGYRNQDMHGSSMFQSSCYLKPLRCFTINQGSTLEWLI